MHRLSESADPLIVSISGSLSLDASIAVAIQTGELEPDGAFGCFSGTCESLAPGLLEANGFEAQEGFWTFKQGLPVEQITGELGWFQTGVYTAAPPVLPVPLLVHAAARSVNQLGEFSLSSVRVQIPHVASAINQQGLQTLLDQFSALTEVRSTVAVRARLLSAGRTDRWTSVAKNWLDNTNIEPFEVTNISDSAYRSGFDNRWSNPVTKKECGATFDSLEWSPEVASTIVLLMTAMARAAGINGTFVVDVAPA